MSINYHAYQNRGFPFSTIEEIRRKWRDIFTGFDPDRVAGILGLERDHEYLYIEYYDDIFRLRLTDGVLEKKLKQRRERMSYADLETGETVILDPDWTEDVMFNEAMSVYHILYYVKDDAGKSGEWLTNENIINSNGRKDLPDPLLDPFAAKFSGRTAELADACEKCGGIKTSDRGDVCYEFLSFPCIPLRLVFWDADEDFPASVKMLFDSKVTDYVHIETTGCIISDLFERLEAAAGF